MPIIKQKFWQVFFIVSNILNANGSDSDSLYQRMQFKEMKILQKITNCSQYSDWEPLFYGLW